MYIGGIGADFGGERRDQVGLVISKIERIKVFTNVLASSSSP